MMEKRVSQWQEETVDNDRKACVAGEAKRLGMERTSDAGEAKRSDAERTDAEPSAVEGSDAGRVFGYARVSSRDQNLDRQLIALRSFPVEDRCIYADTASGKDFERPSYKRLLARLKPGDVMVIKSIDRLGRNYNEILEQWRAITKVRRAHVVVLDMPLLDTRTSQGGITGVFLADVVLQLLSYVAQVERESIHQRQAEGIAAARERGVRFGRPCIERPSCYDAVRAAYLRGELTRKEAACRLNVGTSTFGRWLRSDRLQSAACS